MIGFISKFFVVNHAHGQLLEGIIRELDRSIFYVVALTIPNPQNTLLPSIKESADEIIELPFALLAVRSMVGALGLDILVFADMLSEPLSYFMGIGTRLAPVQALFWGNPLTSGSSANIDYFITGEWMEPEGKGGSTMMVTANTLSKLFDCVGRGFITITFQFLGRALHTKQLRMLSGIGNPQAQMQSRIYAPKAY